MCNQKLTPDHLRLDKFKELFSNNKFFMQLFLKSDFVRKWSRMNVSQVKLSLKNVYLRNCKVIKFINELKERILKITGLVSDSEEKAHDLYKDN